MQQTLTFAEFLYVLAGFVVLVVIVALVNRRRR